MFCCSAAYDCLIRNKKGCRSYPGRYWIKGNYFTFIQNNADQVKLEEKKYIARVIDAIKNQPARFMPVILFQLVWLKPHIVLGCLGLTFSLLFLYPFIRIARDYMVEFTIVDSTIYIKYLKYNRIKNVEVKINNCKVINGLNNGGPGVLESSIWLIRRNNGSTVIMQYRCCDWTKEKLNELANLST